LGNELNYLAHLYLAEDTDESLLGNLLGDFVKGYVGERYAPEIAKGITAHRKIDTFTDAHPIVLESKRLLSPERRRFAGILIDLFYDHLLARHWDQYSAVPLPIFTGRVYKVLERHKDTLPDRLQSAVPFMIKHDWLGSYADLASIERAIDRTSARLKRTNKLAGGIVELELHYLELEAHFRSFFPDLVRFAHTLR
jgi:acyl carrier protein phosphodiesterase